MDQMVKNISNLIKEHMYHTTYSNTHKPGIQTRWLFPKKTPKTMEKRTIYLPHHQESHKTHDLKHQLENPYYPYQTTKSPTYGNTKSS